jgi:hypothetical protein
MDFIHPGLRSSFDIGLRDRSKEWGLRVKEFRDSIVYMYIYPYISTYI